MCELWTGAKKVLQNQMPPSQFVALYKETAATLDGDTLTIFTNSKFNLEWLDFRHRPLIERAVNAEAGRLLTVAFQVQGEGQKPVKVKEKPKGEGKKTVEDNTLEIYGYTPIFDVVATRLGTMTALVFGVVWRHCQMRLGVCTAGVPRLADLTGIAEKTVRRHLAVLVENGYLEDMTPGIRNKAHIYKDTGKIRFRVSVEAIVE